MNPGCRSVTPRTTPLPQTRIESTLSQEISAIGTYHFAIQLDGLILRPQEPISTRTRGYVAEPKKNRHDHHAPPRPANVTSDASGRTIPSCRNDHARRGISTKNAIAATAITAMRSAFQGSAIVTSVRFRACAHVLQRPSYAGSSVRPADRRPADSARPHARRRLRSLGADHHGKPPLRRLRERCDKARLGDTHTKRGIVVVRGMRSTDTSSHPGVIWTPRGPALTVSKPSDTVT